MVRIKICGITNAADALAAVEAGANLLGFNFYEKSPRFVSTDEAEKIRRQKRKRSKRAKEKMLNDKRFHGQKKAGRGRVQSDG